MCSGLTRRTANGRGVLTVDFRLVMDGFVGVRREGAESGAESLQAVGSSYYRGHGTAIERLRQRIPGHVGLRKRKRISTYAS